MNKKIVIQLTFPSLLFALIFLIFVWNKPLLYSMSLNSNEDALSHVLVSCKIAKENPKAFPTIFTYSGIHNLKIDNLPSSSVSDNEGRYYYTSFPPGMFMVPSLFYQLSGCDVTPASLRLFSLFLLVVTSILVGLLCHAAIGNDLDSKVRIYSSLAISLIIFTLFESMKSYTLNYWGQQILQPLMVLGAYFILTNKQSWCIVILAAVSPWLEWSGIIYSFSLFVAVALRWFLIHERKDIFLLILIAISFCFSFALMFYFISNTIPLDEYFKALLFRGGERSFEIKLIPLWILGFLVSLGPISLLVLRLKSLTVICKFIKDMFDFKTGGQASQLLPCMIVLTLPLIENAICLNHAVYYSYDRHKFCIFVVILYFLSHLKKGVRVNYKYMVALNFIGVFCYFCYVVLLQQLRAEKGARFEMIGSKIAAMQVDELPVVQDAVRGNYLYYANRNVVEFDNKSSNREEIIQFLEKKCMTLGYTKAKFFCFDGSILLYRSGDASLLESGMWKD